MKKELVIEMEEECVDCPHLSLVTKRPYLEAEIAIHECEHIDFCKAVRKNWERFHPNCEECDREEPGPFGRSNY